MSDEMEERRIARIADLVRPFPDFPKQGILFRDIFGILKDPAVFGDCINLMSEYLRGQHGSVDVVVGLDARGFIFGPMIAQNLGAAFVPIRKAGKLPGETVQASYSLEYGQDRFEVQKDAVKPGQKIVIVDDLLATGGTMGAAVRLMTMLQADILECVVLIELTDLKGREKVPGKLKAFLEYEGE